MRWLGGIRSWSVAALATVLGGLALVVVPLLATPAQARPLGQVYAFGSAVDFGSPGKINLPVVGMASTPTGNGYWVAATDGGVFAHGDAGFFGSTGDIVLNKPMVGMAATPSGKGYWLVASDGGIFAKGDARFFGSTGAIKLNKPIVGMAVTPTGLGYWLVASDGGIFAFGDAGFFGSLGDLVLNKPVVGMAVTPSGKGYWLVASDGGIFAKGDARFFGSTGSIVLNKPIVGMAPTSTGNGYWFTASDGGVFNYGDAGFFGSLGGTTLSGPVVGMARPADRNNGYWLLDAGNQQTDVCITDPAAEDADTQSRPQIDLLQVCLHATSAGLVVDMKVRSPMTRDQLLTSLRNQPVDNVDSTFYNMTLLSTPDTFANDLSFGADASGPTVDIYSEPDNPDEVPRTIPVGLAVNGSTYSFGAIPYEQLMKGTSLFYFGAVTVFSHATGNDSYVDSIDVAPDGNTAAGPVVKP
jgi:hypothetical protein